MIENLKKYGHTVFLSQIAKLFQKISSALLTLKG